MANPPRRWMALRMTRTTTRRSTPSSPTKALFPSGGSHHFYDVFSADARTLVYQQIYDRLCSESTAGTRSGRTIPSRRRIRTISAEAGARHSLGKGSTVHQCLSLAALEGPVRGMAQGRPEHQARLYPHPQRLGGYRSATPPPYGRGTSTLRSEPTRNRYPRGSTSRSPGCPTGPPTSAAIPARPRRSLFTRWFQFGAFCSIFRIHGQAPKELYGSQWSSATGKANLLAVDTLHYRLMPYLYSLAWKVTNEGYTIMRHLVFDYQTDTNVFDIGSVHVWPCHPGQSRDVRRGHQPVRLSAQGDLVRLLDRRDGRWRQQGDGGCATLQDSAVRKGRIDRPDGPEHSVRHRKHRSTRDPGLQGRKTGRSRSTKTKATRTTTRPASIRPSRLRGTTLDRS
jgi:hypothetical protein